MSDTDTLLLGAVAYDPKVVTIWEGFKSYFSHRGLPFDYVLYSNYERQVESHLAGHFHIAWNSPLAWLDACRKTGGECRAIAMRDTDRDRVSHILVRTDGGIATPGDLPLGVGNLLFHKRQPLFQQVRVHADSTPMMPTGFRAGRRAASPRGVHRG